MTLHISVVIPTFDRAATVDRCLEHLTAQTLADDQFEVIVVDDHSTDDTPNVLERWRGSGRLPMRVGRADTKGFAGGARNHGARLASADRLLFLGDDILAAPDLLEQHLAAASRHGPRSVIVGSVHLTEPEPLPPFMQWLERAGVHHDFPRLRALEGPVSGTYLYACNASVPRADFVAVGGFDERIQRAWEDSELGVRLEAAGLDVWFEDGATAGHVHPQSLGDYVRFLRRGRADVARASEIMRRQGNDVPAPTPHPVLDRVVTDSVVDAAVAVLDASDRWLPRAARERAYRRVIRYEHRRALQEGRRASA